MQRTAIHLLTHLGLLTVLVAAVACGGDDDAMSADGGVYDADSGASDGSIAIDGGPTVDAGDADGGGDLDDGGAPDGGATDGGATDGGATDGGATDGGATDGGASDGGASDGGALDGGPAPTGSLVYLARRDTRRCLSPLCGGFWLSAVNQAATPCADGTMDVECYVAEIDWTATGLSETEARAVEDHAGNLLLEGTDELRTLAGYSLGVLRATAAWQAEWGTTEIPAGESTFYAVMDNGLRCLIPPCFYLDLEVLNSSTRDTASNLDLSVVGASMEDITHGGTAASTGELRVLGTLTTDSTPGPGGAHGETLVAEQFFLPAR